MQAPRERLSYTKCSPLSMCILYLLQYCGLLSYLPVPYCFSCRVVVLLICFCSVQKYCTTDTVLIYYMVILRLSDGPTVCKDANPVFECIWWFSYQDPHLWLWILSAIFSLRMWFNMLIILEWRTKNSHLVSLIPDSLWISVALWHGLIYPIKFQCILIYCSCASSSPSCHRETDGDI